MFVIYVVGEEQRLWMNVWGVYACMHFVIHSNKNLNNSAGSVIAIGFTFWPAVHCLKINTVWTPCKRFGWLLQEEKKIKAQTFPLHVNVLKILQVVFLFLVFVYLWPLCVLCVCRIELCAAGLFLYAFRCFLIVFLVPVFLAQREAAAYWFYFIF